MDAYGLCAGESARPSSKKRSSDTLGARPVSPTSTRGQCAIGPPTSTLPSRPRRPVAPPSNRQSPRSLALTGDRGQQTSQNPIPKARSRRQPRREPPPSQACSKESCAPPAALPNLVKESVL